MLGGLGCGDVWFLLQRRLSKTVRTAREEFHRTLLEDGSPLSVPAEMTPIENQCFADCVALIKEALPKLP